MKWKILIPLIAFGSAPGSAAAQPVGCEVRGGGDANDCYNCQFIRDEHDVWDHENIVIRTLPEQPVDGLIDTIYHCTEDTTINSLTASISVRSTESVSFSQGGSASANIGVNMGLVAGTAFGLSANSSGDQSITNVADVSATRNNVSDCQGVGVEAEYTIYARTGALAEYALVSYYECDCIVFGDGFVLEGALVTYQCYPRHIAARSDLVRGALTSWLRGASFFPPRAPSEYSTSRCSYCANGGGDEDLDPNGDEDGDGTSNADDDTPYGYDGDDPDGDADGDGIPNKDDPTPYGYDGDDPDGDDDGDGIKNSMDPTPNGETILPPVLFYLMPELPYELRVIS